MIEHLEPVHPLVGSTLGFDGSEHPMRQVTKAVAFEADWSNDRRDRVSDLFDSKAAHWTAEHDHPERYLPLDDALTRGGVTGELCLELGSGTGLGTRHLARRFPLVVALDLALEMLRHAPSWLGHLVQADGAHLPFADATFDTVVLVNALLFPSEVDRVLRPEGAVVWVNTVAEATPIHLSPEEVDRALPGLWAGPASRAGSGLWSVHRRV